MLLCDFPRAQNLAQTGAYAAGALVAVSEEVVRFTHALLTGKVMSPEGVREMTTFLDGVAGDVPTQTGYGLGLRRLMIRGQERWGHAGVFPGFSSISMYSPVAAT